MNRRLMMFSAAAAAIGVPYVMTHDVKFGAPAWWDGMWQESSADPVDPFATLSPSPYGESNPSWGQAQGTYSPAVGGRPLPGSPGPAPQGPTAYGPQVRSYGELFRFDVSSAWVMNHWNRVLTRLQQDDLEGFRVVVVSGTSSHDLAGALTYYFNRRQQVERICFQGTTADPARLVHFLSQQYGLQSEPVLGAGLFFKRDAGQIRHAARVQHARVVRADRPYQRFDVTFELNNPQSDRMLSEVFQGVLDDEQRSRRWKPTDPS